MEKRTDRISPDRIDSLAENEIFVFGSNLSGFHGGGAAAFAYHHFGAQWGVGEGLTGHCYAIPTMQGGVRTIAPYVDRFVAFARLYPELHFLVTAIGCGIAGFNAAEIAPLFAAAAKVDNIALPAQFWAIIER